MHGHGRPCQYLSPRSVAFRSVCISWSRECRSGCYLQLNRGANGDAIGSPFKCKVPFEKARGPMRAPNRRTSHIRGRSGLAVRSNVWDKGTWPSDKNGTPLFPRLNYKTGTLLRDLTANDICYYSAERNTDMLRLVSLHYRAD